MGKFVKPFLLSMSFASVGLAVFACKSQPTEEGSETLDAKSKKIAEQVKSFDETRKQMQEANSRNAKGCEKRDILWNKIVETKQPDDDLVPPNSKIREVLAFGNGAAPRFWKIFEGFTAAEGGSEIRPYEKNSTNFVRLTHRFSVMAKTKFVPTEYAKKNYTGQWGEGNDCVITRFSSAVPSSVPDRFTPSVAQKYFQDGPNESQVLIGMNNIGGQSSGVDYTVNPPQPKGINNNAYLKPLSNRLSFEKGVPTGTGAFSRFFYSAQWFAKNVFNIDRIIDPRELQADHLAQRTTTGQTVAAPKGPRFVWFVAPSAEIHDEYDQVAKGESDYRKNFMTVFNKRINGGANPTAFYKVYGSDTWTYTPEKDANLIGEMVATSNFIASEAADVRLFFKHSMNLQNPERYTVPDSVAGKSSPYTHDYPFAEWGDTLFTTECRLGVKEHETRPKDREDLNGTFIRDALVNPKHIRKDAKGRPCIIGIVEERLEETAGPKLQNLLP